MFTRSDVPRPDAPRRRRVALAIGAGAVVLLGGAGAAYAAGSADAVETGWVTVVDDQTTTSPGGVPAQNDHRDCPEYGGGQGSGNGSGSGGSSQAPAPGDAGGEL